MRQIQTLVERGALFVINHSGGKDSQAMTILLKRMVPRDQLLAVHANLGEVEWPGVIDHIKATIGDLPLIICRNENKTFLEMVKHRGKWPSPGQRQCTSDLKRGPIERTIRRYLKANPQFGGLAVNCMGMRAEESPARARKQPFKLNARNSKAGREWYDWLPILQMKRPEVFETIHGAGQTPHWAYSKGMSRLSCVFCIMACKSDLRIAARLNPKLYATYVATEKRICHTMSMSRVPLEEITGIRAGGGAA